MAGKRKTNGRGAPRDPAAIDDIAMIAGETHRAFEDLHRELCEEFSPVGPTEKRLVHRLAVLNWERDRLNRYIQFKIEARQAELSGQVDRAQFFAALKSGAVELRDEKIGEEISMLFEAMDVATQKKSPPEKCQEPRRRHWRKLPGMDVVEGLISLDAGPTDDREIFIKLVEEFPIIERIEKLEQIDIAIDRTIKRLMQLKTMKQMYRQLEPKVISISQDRKSTIES